MRAAQSSSTHPITGRGSPAGPRVRVRMYRPGGIGDCFLLSFPGGCQMLIDCGVLYRTPQGSQKLRAIAEDIEQTTGGHLDIVVATHEHWDHLSGFKAARPVFDRIKFDDVWMAWTEDPADAMARRLHGQRNRALRALDAAFRRSVDLSVENDFTESLEHLLQLNGGLRAARRCGTTEQMDYLRRKVRQPSYLHPGDGPIELPGDGGKVRIFVLGPPRDEALLSRSNPSRAASEVYELSPAINEASAFLDAASEAAAEGTSPDADNEALRQASPFAPSEGLDEADARELWIPRSNGDESQPAKDYFFRRVYGFSDDPERGDEWRRIDSEWLKAAGALALRLDNDTNNTSLVLAIELVESGRVLLFPGDAQVGNCQSWHGLRWNNADGRVVTGRDLLRRTVLYKVSHHGSHNATLRAEGLELMESRELVALVPVEEKQARTLGWRMPFPRLLERLEEKTQGRLLRADRPLRQSSSTECAGDGFAGRVHKDSGDQQLWVEVEIPL